MFCNRHLFAAHAAWTTAPGYLNAVGVGGAATWVGLTNTSVAVVRAGDFPVGRIAGTIRRMTRRGIKHTRVPARTWLRGSARRNEVFAVGFGFTLATFAVVRARYFSVCRVTCAIRWFTYRVVKYTFHSVWTRFGQGTRGNEILTKRLLFTHPASTIVGAHRRAGVGIA